MHWRKLVVSGAHQRGSNEPDLNFPSLCPAAEADQKPVEKKKTNKRVKWVDHFGGEITATKIFTADGDDVEKPPEQSEKPASWSDRKKRDRLRERELLAKAKYVSLKTKPSSFSPSLTLSSQYQESKDFGRR